MNSIANNGLKKNPLQIEVEALATQQWSKLLKANDIAEIPNGGQDSNGTQWQNRLTVALPSEWPMKEHKLVFYAYSRGVNLKNLRDGEYAGHVWAKVESAPTLRLILLKPKQWTTKDVVGMYPLTEAQTKILEADPVALLKAKRSDENDKKIKEFYCLQKSVGHFPAEVIQEHQAFFNWLSCK